MHAGGGKSVTRQGEAAMQYRENMHNSFAGSRLSSSAGSTSIEIVGNNMNASFLQAQWVSWVDDSAKGVCCVHLRDGCEHDRTGGTPPTSCPQSECFCCAMSQCQVSEEKPLPQSSDGGTWSEKVSPDARPLPLDKVHCALPVIPVLEEDVEDEYVDVASLDAVPCADQVGSATRVVDSAAQPDNACSASAAHGLRARRGEHHVDAAEHHVTPYHDQADYYGSHCMSNYHTIQRNNSNSNAVHHEKDDEEEDDEEEEEVQYPTSMHGVLMAAMRHGAISARVEDNEHGGVDDVTHAYTHATVYDDAPTQHDRCTPSPLLQDQVDNDGVVVQATIHNYATRLGSLPPLVPVRPGCQSLERVRENDDSDNDDEEDFYEACASQQSRTASCARATSENRSWPLAREAGSVPRIELRRQDFYGSVIGRGGDRGSCVYRVCRGALTTSPRRSCIAIDEGASMNGQATTDAQGSWVAQKVYPRQMLQSEVEFTEAVSLRRRAHLSASHKIVDTDAGALDGLTLQSATNCHGVGSNYDDDNPVCSEYAEVSNRAYRACECTGDTISRHTATHVKDAGHVRTEGAIDVTCVECEECYAARHLVLAEAIVVMDHEDRGVIMPLYDCSLKDFLLRSSGQSHPGNGAVNHTRHRNNNNNDNNYNDISYNDNNTNDCCRTRTSSDACWPGCTAAHSQPHAHSSGYTSGTDAPVCDASVPSRVHNRDVLVCGQAHEVDSTMIVAAASAAYTNSVTDSVSTGSLSASEAKSHLDHDRSYSNSSDCNSSGTSTGSCSSSSDACRRGGCVDRPVSQSSAFLHRRSYLPLACSSAVSGIVFQLLIAVAWMHDRLPHRAYGGTLCTGYVHNDIHLSNILLDLRSGRVALCDFELASHASARRGSARRMVANEVGTRLPPYSRQSPHGLLCPEADTWAVGLVVLNLLTGVDPLLSNEAIMDDFGDGPLLMPYSSPDRPPNTPVLDWNGNMHAHVLGLLAREKHSAGGGGMMDAETRGLLDVCAGCFANSPSAQPRSARELLHHAVFDCFREQPKLAESTVLEWIQSQALA